MRNYSPRFSSLAWIALSPLLLALAVPFWEAKSSSEWSLDEVRELLTGSPWAQMVGAGKNNLASPIQVYIATAEPMQLAEDRARAAAKVRGEDPSWADYREYLVENTGKYIVFAIRVTDPQAFLSNSETKRMEDESELRIGKRKYKVAGHFPPSSTDPYARLAFPRDVRPGDRVLVVNLYVPGSGNPYRTAEFTLKDLVFKGQPSY